MRNLSNIINEKLKINKDIKVAELNDLKTMDFEEFSNEIESIFDLNSKESENMFLCFDTDIDVRKLKKYQFAYLNGQNPKNKELMNYGGELVNHPLSYKKLGNSDSFTKIYTNNDIDFIVYLYKEDDKEYLYFIDHRNFSFYIYEIIK